MTKRALFTAGLLSFLALFIPFAGASPFAETAIVGPTSVCAQDDELDPCFSGCHDHGMWWLNRDECDLECAGKWFVWCMEKFCGGM